MTQPNPEELCQCGHRSSSHFKHSEWCSWPCPCRSFQPKPESEVKTCPVGALDVANTIPDKTDCVMGSSNPAEGTSEPSPAGSGKVCVCTNGGFPWHNMPECPYFHGSEEPAPVPATGEARKTFIWQEISLLQEDKIEALQRELAEAKEEYPKHIGIMSTHIKRRTDALMSERAAHEATRQQLATARTEIEQTHREFDQVKLELTEAKAQVKMVNEDVIRVLPFPGSTWPHHGLIAEYIASKESSEADRQRIAEQDAELARLKEELNKWISDYVHAAAARDSIKYPPVNLIPLDEVWTVSTDSGAPLPQYIAGYFHPRWREIRESFELQRSRIAELENERDVEVKAAQRLGNGLFTAIIKRMSPYFPEGSRELEWDVLPSVIGGVCESRTKYKSERDQLRADLTAIRSSSEWNHACVQHTDAERLAIKCPVCLARENDGLRTALAPIAKPWLSGKLNGAIPETVVKFTKQNCMDAASALTHE